MFQIMITDGHSDIFVPTSELSTVVHLTHFYLSQNVPVLLLGETGCGKSVAFSKVTSVTMLLFSKDPSCTKIN